MIVLTPAIAGLYAFHLAGSWRWIYVVGAVVALYFNVFVLVVQSFLKVPALHALAPKGSEPPFAIAQGIVLVLFILAGIKAVRRFQPCHKLGSVESRLRCACIPSQHTQRIAWSCIAWV